MSVQFPRHPTPPAEPPLSAHNAPVLRLGAGETAVVGYGSLLSKTSLERTIGRRYNGPFEIAHLQRWRRTWDISMPNNAFYFVNREARVYPRAILYLNIHRDVQTSANVIVFALPAHELAAMHDREWIYTPEIVTMDLRDIDVIGGDAIAYVGRPEYELHGIHDPREAAIRASYLRVIDDGLASMSAEYRIDFWRTTDAAPRDLVVEDTLDPERGTPWAGAGRVYQPWFPNDK